MDESCYRYLLVGLLIGLLSSGCATSVAGGNLQELESFPAAPEAPIKANLIVTGKDNAIGFLVPTNDLAIANMGRAFAINAFKESGYFSEVGPTIDVFWGTVGPAVDNPDIQIKVRFQRKHEPSFWKEFITIFSLNLIPTERTQYFILDADVTNLKTGQTRSYHLEESVTRHIQVFYIFMFKSHQLSVGDVVKNMFKHLAVNMHEDGLLTTAQIGTNHSL